MTGLTNSQVKAKPPPKRLERSSGRSKERLRNEIFNPLSSGSSSGAEKWSSRENKSEFRRPRQILNLLSLFPQSNARVRWKPIPRKRRICRHKKLLKDDLRQQWWRNYGKLNGQAYEGLPKELMRRDLDEITAQPLLNYLVALSLTRDKLDFKKDINLNSIYADLIAAVHERGCESVARTALYDT